jgi:hypothetical protein
MRKTLYALVLMLALRGSAFAGDIGCPPIAPGDINSPPSSTQSADGSTNTSAATATADTASEGNVSDLSEVALNVLNSVLALL